jgi:hypothetical protein
VLSESRGGSDLLGDIVLGFIFFILIIFFVLHAALLVDIKIVLFIEENQFASRLIVNFCN